jgi:hypothetical protein
MHTKLLAEQQRRTMVRALTRRLSALSVIHSKSGLYIGFLWRTGRLAALLGAFRTGQAERQLARVEVAAAKTAAMSAARLESAEATRQLALTQVSRGRRCHFSSPHSVLYGESI